MKYFYVPPQVFEVSHDETQVRKYVKLEELPSLGVAQAYQMRIEGAAMAERKAKGSEGPNFTLAVTLAILTSLLVNLVAIAF